MLIWLIYCPLPVYVSLRYNFVLRTRKDFLTNSNLGYKIHPAHYLYIPSLPGGQAVLLHVDLRDGGVQAPLLRPDRYRRLLGPKPDRAQH